MRPAPARRSHSGLATAPEPIRPITTEPSTTITFVTLCCECRTCLFGEVIDGGMHLNAAGEMIQAVWGEIPANYPDVGIAGFVVMPNHVHGIIVLAGATRRDCPDSGSPSMAEAGRPRGQPGQSRGVAHAGCLSLPDMVHRFKTMTTRRYADGVKQSGWSPFPGRLWQRNYWEHVVRDEQDYLRINEYIRNNPARWAEDKLHPMAPFP